MAAYHRRRRRFTGSPRSPVMQETKTSKRKTKCRGCHQPIQVGETCVRLRLRKAYRQPCATCAHKLLGVRWYHEACVPTDTVGAMGYVPGAPRAAASTPFAAPAPFVAPPPKPLSAADASLAALIAIENALKRRIAESPALVNDASLAKTLDTYNACKAHALRNLNDNEARLGLKNALKRSLDLVF